MSSAKKETFESYDLLRCPHCGDISRVDVKGRPVDFWIASGGAQEWEEKCSNCGKKFGVITMFKIFKGVCDNCE